MVSKSFREPRSLSIRIWHWLNALVILGLLGTVLLRKTFLSWRSNSALISSKLEAAGTTISSDLAKDIAVSIRNPMWDWHIYLGFALTWLLISRVIIAFTVEKKCAITSSVSNLLNEKKKSAPIDWHYHLVKIFHSLFYVVTFFMVVSGLTLTFKAEWGVSKELATSIKDIHELTMWFFVAFTALHILGVTKAEVTKDQGLVSDMISGGKDLKK